MNTFVEQDDMQYLLSSLLEQALCESRMASHMVLGLAAALSDNTLPLLELAARETANEN